MPNPESEKRYIPIKCWKCSASNNWARSQLCTRCGCYLKLHEQGDSSNLHGESIFEQPVLKSALAIAAISFLLLAGVVYYLKNSKTQDSAAKSPAAAEQNILPSNSWYRPSIWSLYRSRPTAAEVLEKNNQAISKIMKPGVLKTLALNGSVSFASGDCPPEGCGEQEEPRKDNYDSQKPFPPPAAAESAEDFSRLSFEPIGEIEFYQKEGGKIYRKIMIHPKKAPARTDITEVFNGARGWKEEVIYNREAVTETLISDLNDKELAELKKVSDAWMTDYTEKNLSFSHIAEVNGKPQFVLKTGHRFKPEAYYFDAVTGLLTKLDSAEISCFFFPYADYQGVNLPSTLYFRSVSREAKTVWMKVEEIAWKINEPIEDSLFERKPQN